MSSRRRAARGLTGAACALSLVALAACATNATGPVAGPPVMGAMVTDPPVGGAPMYPTMNIIQNASHSPDHTTLVAAVKAAGLVETLEGPGPFTVFAPTNAAFAELPAGTVQSLLLPKNKAQLASILTYHVVPGRFDLATIRKMIDEGNGRAILRTVNGHTLTLVPQPGGLAVIDDRGTTALVTVPDVYQSNGVIMVINKVLMP